ncbi:polyketide cyclase [Cupriavidus sp. UYMU48A]|nr:polyketide cyclase [Cupriavidus sp. UYMU48A]
MRPHTMLFRVLVVVAIGIALLFVPLPWTDTTRIHNEAVIARPPAAVFDYVSTPGNWPSWHPSSLGVAGATDHSLQPGERVTETFVVAGRSGVVVWTVTKSDPPRAWVIEGEIEGRKAGTVTYTLTPALTPTLTPAEESTRFERDFTYHSPTLLFVLLNRVVLRPRIEAESAEAVRRLKARLEPAR